MYIQVFIQVCILTGSIHTGLYTKIKYSYKSVCAYRSANRYHAGLQETCMRDSRTSYCVSTDSYILIRKGFRVCEMTFDLANIFYHNLVMLTIVKTDHTLYQFMCVWKHPRVYLYIFFVMDSCHQIIQNSSIKENQQYKKRCIYSFCIK